MKIRIFQPIVPEYRVALFDGLASRYGRDIETWAAERLGADISYPLSKMRSDYNHPFCKLGPFVWQKGLSLKGLKRGDVVIVCGDVHQLSSLWISFKAKCCGVKVVWWGHHKTASSSKYGVKIRLTLARLISDVMLTYTKTGVGYLLGEGFKETRVFATGNTINQIPIKEAIAQYDGKDPFGGRVGFLCCSVLREKVRLDLAIRALAEDKLSGALLAVIGDGPAKDGCVMLAKELGVEDRIIWVGATRDQKVMAPWFLNAKAFVYPGSVGLSILHAMSYGLPVIAHDNAEHQMPEYEVMENGKTGLVFSEGDVKSLADKMSLIVADASLFSKMSKRAKELAYTEYSMDRMVQNFSEAIEACRNEE